MGKQTDNVDHCYSWPSHCGGAANKCGCVFRYGQLTVVRMCWFVMGLWTQFLVEHAGSMSRVKHAHLALWLTLCYE